MRVARLIIVMLVCYNNPGSAVDNKNQHERLLEIQAGKTANKLNEVYSDNGNYSEHQQESNKVDWDEVRWIYMVNGILAYSNGIENLWDDYTHVQHFQTENTTHDKQNENDPCLPSTWDILYVNADTEYIEPLRNKSITVVNLYDMSKNIYTFSGLGYVDREGAYWPLVFLSGDPVPDIMSDGTPVVGIGWDGRSEIVLKSSEDRVDMVTHERIMSFLRKEYGYSIYLKKALKCYFSYPNIYGYICEIRIANDIDIWLISVIEIEGEYSVAPLISRFHPSDGDKIAFTNRHEYDLGMGDDSIWRVLDDLDGDGAQEIVVFNSTVVSIFKLHYQEASSEKAPQFFIKEIKTSYWGP